MNGLKKQDIREAYTQKVTELLNQGYTIFPDTMNGHQGEIAHIDLSNGFEILRVLLLREPHWGRDFSLDTITLTVGKAAPDTRVGDRWDGTIWNNRLEPRFQIEWAEINAYNDGWYTDMEEGRRIARLRRERYIRGGKMRRETLSDAFKSAALKWIHKQPRMKTCKLTDIEKVERVWHTDGKRHFEITAKGKTYAVKA